MPYRLSSISTRLATICIAISAIGFPSVTQGQSFTGRVVAPRAPGSDRADKNIILSADTVSRDAVNNTVSATGHVEFVQGPSMLLAEHVIWNQNTDIVIAPVM